VAHLVVMVLEDTELTNDVLRAWEGAGASGATVLESTGLMQFTRSLRDDLPLLPSLRDVEGSQEYHQRTLFTVVADDETLARVFEASERIVGDFDRPYSGLLFSVPVGQVRGLRRPRRA
jgi:hypothetical protein